MPILAVITPPVQIALASGPRRLHHALQLAQRRDIDRIELERIGAIRGQLTGRIERLKK
jgi:hypothetical protein